MTMSTSTTMITATAMVPVSTAIIIRPIRMPPIATGRASAIRTIWSKSRRCSPICAIPQEIYRLSFETIRREAPVDGLPSDIAGMAVRLIHACGMTDILSDLVFSPDIVQAGRAALAGGAPLLCDTAMTAGESFVAIFPPPMRFSPEPRIPRRSRQPGASAIPEVRRPSISGASGSTARWWSSAMRRRRSSV